MTEPDERPLADDADGQVSGELVVLEQGSAHCCCRQSVSPLLEKAALLLAVVILLEVLIVLSVYTGGVLAHLVHELFG